MAAGGAAAFSSTWTSGLGATVMVRGPISTGILFPFDSSTAGVKPLGFIVGDDEEVEFCVGGGGTIASLIAAESAGGRLVAQAKAAWESYLDHPVATPRNAWVRSAPGGRAKARAAAAGPNDGFSPAKV